MRLGYVHVGRRSIIRIAQPHTQQHGHRLRTHAQGVPDSGDPLSAALPGYVLTKSGSYLAALLQCGLTDRHIRADKKRAAT